MARFSGTKALTISLGLCLSMTYACKKSLVTPPSDYRGFILGPDNMIASDASTIPFNGSSLNEIRATGTISSLESGRGSHFCTGFLLAPAVAGANPRVVTNYHCFTSSGLNSGPFADWACRQTKIYLGLKVDDFNSLYTVGCKTGSLRGHEAADIAVFEIANAIPGDIKVFELETFRAQPQQARVVHHPVVTASMVAPPGDLQKLPGSVISSESCAIQEPAPDHRQRPESGFMFDLAHTCDIVEGSSGAPIISVSTGKVIAVNWGGIEWTGDNAVQENRAIPSDWVHAFLTDTLAEYEAKANQALSQQTGKAAPQQPSRPKTTSGGKSHPGGCALAR